jgi:dipeptidyl aminopeptidase/acylaminoacyl peptidase
MRKDIQFKTEDGVTLRGWHYLPDGSSRQSPDHRHGPWLFRGKGDVSRPLR